MPEDSVTVMLLPEDDTETILEKVRRAGAKKINLIVPPGNRALQTLGGFTMLRKACDITGLEVTVYSDDEKARDMAQVCRFEVVRLDQETRPREVKPAAEEPARIVVSTKPPEPTREPPAAAPVKAPAEARPAGLEERLGGLSADDLALFDALEGMSMDEDVELRAESFARPAAAAEAAPRPVVAPRQEQPAKEKRPKKPSPFRFILEPLAGLLAYVYMGVVSVFLRVASRFQPKRKEAVVAGAEAPAAVGPVVRTDEEVQRLQATKKRYYIWTAVAVVVVTLLVVGIYLLSLPTVTVSLTPRAAETQEMDLSLNVALTNTVDTRGPKSVPTVDKSGTVTLSAQKVQVDMQGQASTEATGKQRTAEGMATGAVVFTNLTQYAVAIPVNTVLAGGGATFHTTQDIIVPASDFVGSDAYVGKAQVGITADTPGSAGNVDAWVIDTVEGDPGNYVFVINEEPTGGGSERDVVVVTAEDHDRLRQKLVTELQSKAYAELQAKLQGLEVLSGTLKVETVEENFNQSVGSQASTFTLTAKVQASALASAPGALDKAVEQAVQQKLGQSKSGQEIGTITHGAIQGGQPGSTANVWAYRTHASVPILSTIDDKLKSEILGALRGKSYKEIKKVMEGFRDRIGAFSVSPVLDGIPGWIRIRVQEVGQAK